MTFLSKTLECHSKGDRRFSPFFCRVNAFGVSDSIENHYQRSKVFEGAPTITTWQDAKRCQKQGLRQVGWKIGQYSLPVKSNHLETSFDIEDFGVQWYVALWEKYLRLHPGLLAELGGYDDFSDPFSRDFPVPQSKIFRICRYEGIDKLKDLWIPLSLLLKNNRDIPGAPIIIG